MFLNFGCLVYLMILGGRRPTQARVVSWTLRRWWFQVIITKIFVWILVQTIWSCLFHVALHRRFAMALVHLSQIRWWILFTDRWKLLRSSTIFTLLSMKLRNPSNRWSTCSARPSTPNFVLSRLHTFEKVFDTIDRRMVNNRIRRSGFQFHSSAIVQLSPTVI